MRTFRKKNQKNQKNQKNCLPELLVFLVDLSRPTTGIAHDANAYVSGNNNDVNNEKIEQDAEGH